jgi:uncharacterized repeat protein (TIGR01451 family)
VKVESRHSVSAASRLTFFLLLVVCRYSIAHAQTVMNYSFSNRGAVSLPTQGTAAGARLGYVRVQPNSGTTPSGIAIFGYRPSGILVSEAGVPTSAPILSGRIYAEVNPAVNTGLAIANPNAEEARISFFFTDSAGINFGHGETRIPANNQRSMFLNESPFNGGSSINGTFSFTSDVPVSVIALRGLTNARGEFLMTTLPVLNIAAPFAGTVFFPHFADGGGWTSDIILVNPREVAISGRLVFFGQFGAPVLITARGEANSTFSYTIPPNSSIQLKTSNLAASTVTGSVRAIPDTGSGTPSGLLIFSFNRGGITVSEAGVSAVATNVVFRTYVEASEPGNSIMSGIALTNPSPTGTTVNLELTTLSGASTGLSAQLVLGGNGHEAQFLNEIAGFEQLPRPFKGVLRISTASPAGIAVTALRSRTNERGDYLVTTTPVDSETGTAATTETFFPHFADGIGYNTQFILFSASASQSSAGVLRFIGPAGVPINPSVAPTADLRITQTGPPNCTVQSNDSTDCSQVKYVIVVRNDGLGVAQNVQLVDTLPVDPPSGVPVSAVTLLSVGQGTCSTPAGAIRCNIGTMAGSTAVVLNATMFIDSTALGRVITNALDLGSSTPDLITANNASNADLSVFPIPASTDLQLLQLTASPAPIRVGNNLTYTIRFVNAGPSTATNVILRSAITAMPGSFQFVSANSSRGTCSFSAAGVVVCDVGTLRRNFPQSITIVVRATAAGSLENDVEILGNPNEKVEFDPDTSNNRRTVTTVVNP